MQDILLDSNNDMIIENNDAVFGVSDLQHIHHLLLLPKASLRQSPLSTSGVETFLKDSDIHGMLYEVRTCFINDGMTVRKLKYNENTGDLDYDARYNN